jgi:glycosyltransferase involved in cell wall biosynthesis
MTVRHLFLISDATATCGVEEFARQAALRMGAPTLPLGRPLEASDDVVINLPVVAWKKRPFAPIAAALRARSSGEGVTLVLHEWADLALARRISYLPLLPLATRIFFSSPEVMAQFDATPVSRVVTKTRRTIPIPPNFVVPEWTQSSALSDSLAADRAKGRFVLAQFGSIYPKKDPFLVLETAAELVRRGVDPRVVFIGSFVGAEVESNFWSEVERLGLKGHVEVTGYIQSATELYGVFAQVDAFAYPLGEGLTSRRASVQAAALSGRPVVVSAPADANSLSHHRLLKSLIATGTVQLVPRAADAAAFADAVLATRGMPLRSIAPRSEVDAIWRDVIGAFDA